MEKIYLLRTQEAFGKVSFTWLTRLEIAEKFEISVITRACNSRSTQAIIAMKNGQNARSSDAAIVATRYSLVTEDQMNEELAKNDSTS
jgi:hypothetical protein